MFPALDGGHKFPRVGRDHLLFFQGVDGVFSFPLCHVPGSVGSPPVTGGVGHAARSLFGDGEFARRRIPGNREGLERFARDGVEAGHVVFGSHLSGEVERDAVAGGRDVFNAGESVPQVPDLPDGAVGGAHDVQFAVEVFPGVGGSVFGGVAGGVFQRGGRACRVADGVARVGAHAEGVALGGVAAAHGNGGEEGGAAPLGRPGDGSYAAACRTAPAAGCVAVVVDLRPAASDLEGRVRANPCRRSRGDFVGHRVPII